MKNILAGILSVTIISVLIVGCSQQLPNVRVYNQSSDKANVQFKQANDNTININEVASGATSDFRQIIEGQVIVTAVVQNLSASLTTTFKASNDHNYTIVILSNNTLRVDIENQ